MAFVALLSAGSAVILVSMTRITGAPENPAKRPPKGLPGRWPLQTAKARFSELVRTARSKGPQHVTVHGRDEVVVVAAEEFQRLKSRGTGLTLIKALQSSPHREIDLTPGREVMPVRSVSV